MMMSKKPRGKSWQPGQSGNPEGRPKRKSFRECATEEDFKEFWESVRALMKKRDARTTQWVGDQLFGKAPTPLTGEDGGPVQVMFVDNLE